MTAAEIVSILTALTTLIVAIRACFAVQQVHELVNSRMTDFLARYDAQTEELAATNKKLAKASKE